MRRLKTEVVASRGVVVSNHPLATAAGVEILLSGGNAIDAAVAVLFSLSVVEPMMVSPFGGGFFVIRDGSSGEICTIDNYSCVPAAARPDLFTAVHGGTDYEVVDHANAVGYLAVGTPGALSGWNHAVERYGTMPLSRLLRAAIRQAGDGFPASAYLVRLIGESAADISRFPATAQVFLPGGAPPAVGQQIRRPDYAASLEQIAHEGPDALYRGTLGQRIVDDVEAHGGLLSMADLASYRVREVPPVRGSYRGHELVSVAPPSAGGTHLVQMLNILETFPMGREELTFGAPGCVHLIAEALRIVFEDRSRYMGDPDRIDVPVDMLTSKAYAADCRGRIGQVGSGAPRRAVRAEELETTHCTVVDEQGTVVSTTQTLQTSFGSKVTVPGTGMLLNNFMLLMDPTPGGPNSIEGGKRILSSMAPTIVLRGGRPVLALGTPGGRRIFGSVGQAITNVIDHGMTMQDAVDAPRCWTQGEQLELETRFDDRAGLARRLSELGHDAVFVDRVAGGMNGVLFDADGWLHGAACWRADGVPAGIGGGPAFPR
jgi:gamma-glutamyltranspeptidase / glutathione hydrolase